MKKYNLKRKFFKQIVLLSVVLSLVLTASCSGTDDEVVFSYGDKVITTAVYNCYYEKNKQNILKTYKGYYTTYGEAFKAYFGFSPKDSDLYWENEFWNEKQTGYDQTMHELLVESTVKGCKEYLVYEKIASDYNYTELPKEIVSQFESLENESIKNYGSYEAWNIATLGQYGITAEELMNLSYISSYGTVLPQHIFGENGDKIDDETALNALQDSIQFMYSVYYFNDDLEVEESEIEVSNEDDSSLVGTSIDDSEADKSNDVQDENDDSKEESTDSTSSEKKYNDYCKERMKTNYEKVLNGEKSFDEVYKDSDDYSYIKESAPNGFVLTKTDFNNYFSVNCEEYKTGDIILVENESGIFMIKFVDFTSDYIKAKKSYLISDLFDEILESYFKDVKTY